MIIMNSKLILQSRRLDLIIGYRMTSNRFFPTFERDLKLMKYYSLHQFQDFLRSRNNFNKLTKIFSKLIIRLDLDEYLVIKYLPF